LTWNLACPDWEARLRSGRSLVPDLPLNTAEGDRAVAVFNKLRLHDVPGTPTMADAAGDWFRDIVRALFGSLDPVTKARMIRELFLLVPKKNNKTTGGALLMLTALLLNLRPRATFIMTAPVQDTAEMAFNAAAGAIQLDPVLDKLFHVREHLKTIVHRETKADLSIFTFDVAALTGLKVSGGALIDELHVVASMAKADRALRQLRGGMMPYPESFLAFITTQSEEAPAGVFKAELEKARAIRDGERTGPMLPVLYEFPRKMQQAEDTPWKDPANWPMVTPNLGRSIQIDALIAGFEDAEAKGEGELRAWASQHLDVEIGLALRSDRWAGADFWQKRAAKLSFEDLLERCEVIVVGIDGGGLDDLLGFCAIGRERETRQWLAWHHAWAHRIVLERRKDIAARLLDFKKAGELTIVEEPGDDVDGVADRVCAIRDAGLLPGKHAIGVDAVGIGDIVDELTAEHRGITTEQIIGISQGWKLNGAIKTTERKLAGRELTHGGTALMDWCVGNAKVEPKGNAITITKAASGNAKIDPLMATFNAVTLMALDPEAVEDPTEFLKNPVIA
jgi:phage terminase large subunit-like protein